MLGANLKIDSIDDIAHLFRRATDLGIDAIELGCGLGIMMEQGLIEWGDGAHCLEIVSSPKQFPYLLNGARETGRHLGAERIPTVKGQALPAFDPRSLKGNGVTYATSPQGPDHTAGHTLRSRLSPHLKHGQVQASLTAQVSAAYTDTLGVCLFAMPALSQHLGLLTEIMSNPSDRTWRVEDLDQLGYSVLKTELLYNRKAGLTSKDDRLAAFFSREPLPPANTTFDITPQELDQVASAFVSH